jgi:hypothetical protein
LDDVAGTGRIDVQFLDLGLELCSTGRGGQLDLDGGDADLSAVAMLAGHVGAAAGIVADQHGAEAGDDPPISERGHPELQLGLDRRRKGPTVEDLGGHRDHLTLIISGRSAGHRSRTWWHRWPAPQ